MVTALTGGFRPFFLLGALTMAASALAWIPIHLWGATVPSAFTPRDWHIHTMLFGGLMAIVAGFALTAVSNWTGRPMVAGRPLLALVALWVAGRVAVSTSAIIGPGLAMAVDLAFPVALCAVFSREVIAGSNLRNLRIVALVGLLATTDAAFHLEAMAKGSTDHAARAAVSAVLVLVTVLGGRIIPAFTRNWLAAQGHGPLPAPFARLDVASILAVALALISWIIAPSSMLTAGALLAAGILAMIRLARWHGFSTRAEPMLFILHLGFATIPLGLLAVAASIVRPDVIDPTAAVHVWTVGTVGTMTLAVMTRASRGHTGRAVAAGGLEIAIYLLVLVGLAARVAAPYAPDWLAPTFMVAAAAWAAAYLLFAAGYARSLLS